MRKPVFKFFWLLLCAFSLWGCGGRPGVPSYMIGDGRVTITDCAEAAQGGLEIPAEIEGLPVTSIGESAFRYCSSLTSITISEGVTSIRDKAFKDCSSLTSITLPEGVTSIGFAAFSGCSSLISITIPEGVTSIGDRAFFKCDSLTLIIIPEAFHSEAEASRLDLDELWPDGFALPDSSSK